MSNCGCGPGERCNNCPPQENEEFDALELREGVERLVEQNVHLRARVAKLQEKVALYKARPHKPMQDDSVYLKIVPKEEVDQVHRYGKHIGQLTGQLTGQLEGLHLYNWKPGGLYLSIQPPDGAGRAKP